MNLFCFRYCVCSEGPFHVSCDPSTQSAAYECRQSQIVSDEKLLAENIFLGAVKAVARCIVKKRLKLRIIQMQTCSMYPLQMWETPGERAGPDASKQEKTETVVWSISSWWQQQGERHGLIQESLRSFQRANWPRASSSCLTEVLLLIDLILVQILNYEHTHTALGYGLRYFFCAIRWIWQIFVMYVTNPI